MTARGAGRSVNGMTFLSHVPVTPALERSCVRDAMHTPIAEAAATEAITVNAEESLQRAAQLMAEHGVVVGSRGHGPMASVLIGSTARKLMRTAPCPVAVVPRPH